MTPGPVEISPRVQAALAESPRSHAERAFVEDLQAVLRGTRALFGAAVDAQPMVVPGNGTTAMDMAVSNLIQAGDRVVVVDTGVFSERWALMLARRGAEVCTVYSQMGRVPPLEHVADELVEPAKALFITHVDTSTGVRAPVRELARLGRDAGALVVVDGVCSVGALPFEHEAWGVDVAITASQKGLSLPPGLGLLVASPAALAAHSALSQAPAFFLDWSEWLAVHRAYEAGDVQYFATPPTSLVHGLRVALDELFGDDPRAGLEARWALQARAGRALRAAWAALGLRAVVLDQADVADTLSALYFPEGVDQRLFAEVLAREVLVAAPLHPLLRGRSFRVGHLGHVLTRPDALEKAVRAIAEGLQACGAPADADSACRAFAAAWGDA